MSGKQKTLGILREAKSKWERRVPVTPKDVRKLVDNGFRVLVQPCERRVFANQEFERNGAEISEDLSSAHAIVGVKEFHTDYLADNKSYLTFNHVIKAQEANMPFLDAALSKKNLRLFDYEIIRSYSRGGSSSISSGAMTSGPVVSDTVGSVGPRLVAFGRFAGLAGMITGLRGFGEHLLGKGAATPLLNVGQTFTYPSLERAKLACAEAGGNIKEFGLPMRLGPMVFGFTGRGNVTKGALELFELFPHEYITVERLQSMFETLPNGKIKAIEGSFDNHKFYGVKLDSSDLVQPIDSLRSGVEYTKFDSKHYYSNPELYEPVFHNRVAPYISVLFNGMYWDYQYPRLLTCQQIANVHSRNQNAIMAVFDVTCDIGGSIEFLTHSTTHDSPFLIYDPLCHEVSDTIDGTGVLVLGVDSLPAELPREASEHFSSQLLPFIPSMLECDLQEKNYIAQLNSDELSTLEAIEEFEQESGLPMEMFNACVVSNGELCRNFDYIDTLRQRRMELQNAAKGAQNRRRRKSSTQKSKSLMKKDSVIQSNLLRIDGHLFDSSLINQLLDLIENEGAFYSIVELFSGVNLKDLKKASRLIIQIDCHSSEWSALKQSIESLIKLVPKSQAVMRDLPFGAAYNSGKKAPMASGRPIADLALEKSTLHKITRLDNRHGPEKNVLILGSGFVAKPVVDYLCYSGHNHLTVASNELSSARKLCELHPFAKELMFDVFQESNESLYSLVQKHDIVISLLPAFMHGPIARCCVDLKKHLVTASYVSDEMRALNDPAIEAGVCLINEVGLDPGLDHISALQMINDAQNRGEIVRSFSSVCGGLPCPEVINGCPNPLGYKFSWSPLGVLRAALNDARYKVDDKIIEVSGKELLKQAKPLGHGRRRNKGLGMSMKQEEKKNELMLINPWMALALEVLPNRDSLQYIPQYGIESTQTMFRGTLRYQGFSAVMDAFANLGFMNHPSVANSISFGDTKVPIPGSSDSWKNYLEYVMNDNNDSVSDSDGSSNVIAKVERVLRERGVNFTEIEMTTFMDFCEWLGLFDDDRKLEHEFKSPMDALCHLLESNLCFKEDEHDMVVMNHEIITEDGSNRYKRYMSSLMVTGDAEYSGMSRTVGFPVAVSAQAILDGKLDDNPGVLTGEHPILIERVLNEARDLGYEFKESMNYVDYV